MDGETFESFPFSHLCFISDELFDSGHLPRMFYELQYRFDESLILNKIVIRMYGE